MLGLLAWLYLADLGVVLGIEINVVLAKRLYPRALLTPFTDDVDLTPGGVVAYTHAAQAQQTKGFENVTVTFEDEGQHATARRRRRLPWHWHRQHGSGSPRTVPGDEIVSTGELAPGAQGIAARWRSRQAGHRPRPPDRTLRCSALDRRDGTTEGGRPDSDPLRTRAPRPMNFEDASSRSYGRTGPLHQRRRSMTKYLISFPSPRDGGRRRRVGARQPGISRRRAAGQRRRRAWVFGGGIDETVAPVRVAGDGTVTEGAYPENERLSGGFAVLELPYARRGTRVGGTLRRLLPVPARGLGVHVRPGVLSRRLAHGAR